MNIQRTNSDQDASGSIRRTTSLPLLPLSAAELSETCRGLDARGVKYTVVSGVPVIQQGFAGTVKGENLFEQCLQMNRQAVMRG